MIWSTLKRGPWRKKPPKKGTAKRDMYEKRMQAVQASKAKDHALTWGAEYGDFLRGWYAENGCAACGRDDASGPHLHHTAHRSRKGRAETMVPLCSTCHVEDGEGIEGNAWKRYRVDLKNRARAFAEAGKVQRWLPVERCEAEGCGKWHSAKLMLDDVDQQTGVARRICAECAPPGPI